MTALVEALDGEHILQTHSDSMVNAGILPGDYLIVRDQDTAEDGQIVVAMVDEQATVKRYYRDGNEVRLEPEHDTMEPMVVPEVQILGLVVGVLRTVG